MKFEAIMGEGSRKSYHYQIKLGGHLTGRIAQLFAGWQLVLTKNGQTIIHAEDIDQAALFGILLCIRDAGIPLVSVQRSQGEEP